MVIISPASADETSSVICPTQQWPRGPENELHQAAYDGSTERTLDLLSRGLININQGTPNGWTPLIYAAQDGHSRVARVLLDGGANVSIVADGGITALHMSAQDGHLAVTIDLVNAGADLDAWGVEGATPLHLASQYGHIEVVATLVKAGAKVNSRAGDGRTPLYMAALDGRLGVVKELLRANANPQLTATTRRGFVCTPLDVAVSNGHREVVCELIQHVGVEGCCVGSRGVEVLITAAQQGHVTAMAIVMGAGVVDTGEALCAAAGCGQRAAVQFLLQRRQREGSPTGLAGYVDFRDCLGCTPLLRSIERFATDDRGVFSSTSPKVVRLLIDAGADASAVLRFTNARGRVVFNGTPLAFTKACLRSMRGVGQTRNDANEEQMNMLEAVRRTLLRVDAARAVSWLWAREPLLDGGAGEEVSRRKAAAEKTAASGTQLASMLPILRRRRHGALVAPLFRYANYS